MKIVETKLPDVFIFEPTVHGDDRGYFMESFRHSHFEKIKPSVNFVQDNQSKSKKETLRGLHYQLKYPQDKLVQVIAGEIFDVAVDIRKGSANFGKWLGVVLSAENKKQLWVPAGFAHGFYVLSDSAEMSYKCSEYYHPEDDYSVRWNDKTIGIDWPLISSDPLLSDKDKNASSLADAPLFP